MNIMGMTTADKILTGVVALGALDNVVIPAGWLATTGIDIFMLELWSDTEWTLADDDGGDEVTIAADRVVQLAIRVNKAKTSTATDFPFRAAGSSDLNILAHAVDHAYADQG